MSKGGQSAILAGAGVLLIGLMATQCQKVKAEKPSPSVTVTVNGQLLPDGWEPLPGDLVASLKAGEDADRDWSACLIKYETEDVATTVIVCPDGFMLES